MQLPKWWKWDYENSTAAKVKLNVWCQMDHKNWNISTIKTKTKYFQFETKYIAHIQSFLILIILSSCRAKCSLWNSKNWEHLSFFQLLWLWELYSKSWHCTNLMSLQQLTSHLDLIWLQCPTKNACFINSTFTVCTVTRIFWFHGKW